MRSSQEDPFLETVKLRRSERPIAWGVSPRNRDETFRGALRGDRPSVRSAAASRLVVSFRAVFLGLTPQAMDLTPLRGSPRSAGSHSAYAARRKMRVSGVQFDRGQRRSASACDRGRPGRRGSGLFAHELRVERRGLPSRFDAPAAREIKGAAAGDGRCRSRGSRPSRG